MKRYLIHHDEHATFDLVADESCELKVETIRSGQVMRATLIAFAASMDGMRYSRALLAALERQMADRLVAGGGRE